MKPVAYLLCGPSLAGKSTFALRLSGRSGAAVSSADAINVRRGLPFGGEGLPEAAWAETLRLQLIELDEWAALGRSAVVDDTLCYRWLRDRFRQSAAAAGMAHQLLLFAPPREELLARHAALLKEPRRPVLSRERLLQHLVTFEWPDPDEGAVDLTDPFRQDAWLHTWFPRG